MKAQFFVFKKLNLHIPAGIGTTKYIGIKKQMDHKDCSAYNVKRAKKSDKAKKSYEKNGGFSQKHIRLTEARKTTQSPEKK